MKRTPRPREHARLISTDGGAGLPLAGLGHRVGGARGADHYGLQAVVAAGSAACVRSVVFLAGRLPALAATLEAFVAQGGRGAGRGGGAGHPPRAVAAARAGLGGRGRLPLGPSRGSVFTVREAARTGKSAAVVLAGGGATLPSFPDGQVATDVYGIACRSLSR
jgi:hypothetical protein